MNQGGATRIVQRQIPTSTHTHQLREAEIMLDGPLRNCRAGDTGIELSTAISRYQLIRPVCTANEKLE